MTISLLAHTAKGSTSGTGATCVTAAIDTSGASLIVAAFAQFNTPINGTITDSKSNTWTALTGYIGASNANVDTGVRIVYCAHPTVGSGHTFQPAQNNFPALAVAAFAATLDATTAEFDVGTHNSAATTLQPGSQTPAHNNDVVISAATTNATGTFAVDSSFSITDQVAQVNSQHVGLALAYIIQTTAAAVNPTWSGMTGLAVAMTAFQSAPPVTGYGLSRII